jgi:hypothetical protein
MKMQASKFSDLSLHWKIGKSETSQIEQRTSAISHMVEEGNAQVKQSPVEASCGDQQVATPAWKPDSWQLLLGRQVNRTVGRSLALSYLSERTEQSDAVLF